MQQPVNEEDTPIQITMTLGAWRIVMAHLEGGIYRDVCLVAAELILQTTAQLESARVARDLEEQRKNAAPAVPAVPEAPAVTEKVVH